MGWQWLGNAMHLCVSDKCRFHLATVVGGGRWIVSTVGDYWPDGASEPARIGARRLYETYVFRAAKPHPHGCNCPQIEDLSEVDSQGYEHHDSANDGHMQMCEKWDTRTL